MTIAGASGGTVDREHLAVVLDPVRRRARGGMSRAAGRAALPLSRARRRRGLAPGRLRRLRRQRQRRLRVSEATVERAQSREGAAG